MGVSGLSKDHVGAIARDLDADVSEAGGLVLTVAMPESSCMPERGEVDQEPGKPPAGPGPMRESIRGIRSSKNAPP